MNNNNNDNNDRPNLLLCTVVTEFNPPCVITIMTHLPCSLNWLREDKKKKKNHSSSWKDGRRRYPSCAVRGEWWPNTDSSACPCQFLPSFIRLPFQLNKRDSVCAYMIRYRLQPKDANRLLFVEAQFSLHPPTHPLTVHGLFEHKCQLTTHNSHL